MHTAPDRRLFDPGTTAASAAMVVTAVGLAALSMLCLAVMLAINLSGGSAWSGLTWIPMIGLPLAFILMLVLVVGAILRRRLS